MQISAEWRHWNGSQRSGENHTLRRRPDRRGCLQDDRLAVDRSAAAGSTNGGCGVPAARD
jgi:hypothetical protein